jgi:hypothetical protein
MKRLTFTIFLFTCFQLKSQILVPKKDYVPEVRHARYSFGISLLPSGNTLVSYGIHRMSPDSTVEMNFLSFDSFVRQFSGFEQSKANPDKINYMEEYKITPESIQSLWKLRYAEYPYGQSKEIGWGGKLGMPSQAQMQLLANFGVKNIGDVIYGENLLKLLIKMNDPVWVGQYQLLE